MVTETRHRLVIDKARPPTVHVLPGLPALDEANGVPMATLIGTDTAASVQIGAHWWPAKAELDEMVAAAAAELEVPATTVIVTIGDVEVHGVELIARDSSDEHTLATSTSSGFPPYPAALTGPVPSDLRLPVRQAFGGRPGVLFVRYDATVGGERTRRELDVGSAMHGAPGEHVFLTGMGEAPAPDPGGGLPFALTAAVGELPVGELELSGTDPTGAPWSITVSAAQPAPAALPHTDELQVAVRDGRGGSYRRALRPAPGGWRVDDASLGVVAVTCRAPNRAPGTVVTLRAWYQPAGDGLPDERTVTLAEPGWSASWRLATGAAELKGELVLDVSETTGGGVASTRTVRSDRPDVTV